LGERLPNHIHHPNPEELWLSGGEPLEEITFAKRLP